MFKKIMVAVDGSEIAKQAVEEAVSIANTYNSALCIVHCVGDDASDADVEAGREVLNQTKADINVLSVDVCLLRAEAVYGLNGIAEAVANAVSDWEADLLVVGTSNRKGLERLFLGSVAEQLVTKVASSILLVRPQ